MGANDDIERRGKYNRGCDFRKSSLTGFLSSLGTSRTPCSSNSAAVRLPNSSRLPLIASAALADRDKFSRHVYCSSFPLRPRFGKVTPQLLQEESHIQVELGRVVPDIPSGQPHRYSSPNVLPARVMLNLGYVGRGRAHECYCIFK